MATSGLVFPEAAWLDSTLLENSGNTKDASTIGVGLHSQENRRVFTICSENDAGNPPQGLTSKLSDLEASVGLVTLSSDSNVPTANSASRRPYSGRRNRINMESCRSTTTSNTDYTSIPQNVPYAVHSSQLMSWISGQKPDVKSNEHQTTALKEMSFRTAPQTHNVDNGKTLQTESRQEDMENKASYTTSQYFPQSTTVIFGQRLAETDKRQGETRQKVSFSDNLVENSENNSDKTWSVVSNDGSTATEDELSFLKNSGSSGSTTVMADQDQASTSPLTTPTTPSEENMLASTAPTLKVEYVSKVWDAYINDFLLGSDHIKEAAIYDKSTKACVACSPGFTMRDREFDQLLESLNCLQLAYKVGVTVGGRHFKTVLADGRRGLMAKGEGQTGCSSCQSRTLVILALHDHTGKARRCNEEIMRLGDFFWAKGL